MTGSEGVADRSGLTGRLLRSEDPSVRYQAMVVLEGRDPGGLLPLTGLVRADRNCTAMIDSAFTDPRHPYRKWQGAHWALVQLAERGHPGGDPRLGELQEIVFAWILSPAFLRPNWTRRIDGQPDRIRRCASMEGNVLWSSIQLGLADARLEALADRLVDMQWPDGGWNCDPDPSAQQSSFVETVLGLRGLAAWVQATEDRHAAAALDRGLELVLDHELIFHRNGDLMIPSWGPPPDRIGFPIRFFDVLLTLELMADNGRLEDRRCLRALELLEEKRGADGGFPLEVKRARTAGSICSDCTSAEWGRGGATNPWVTIRALRVLRTLQPERSDRDASSSLRKPPHPPKEHTDP